MPDGKMDPFPQAVGHLNDWYYTYFLNARLAPAAHFPVYQRERRSIRSKFVQNVRFFSQLRFKGT